MAKLAAEVCAVAGADAPTTATTAMKTDATMRLITMKTLPQGGAASVPRRTILPARTYDVNAGQSTLLTLCPGGDESSQASRPVSALGLIAICRTPER